MPLKIDTTKQGTGESAKDGDTLVVHYTGTLTNGKQFDSSRGRGPFEVTLGQRRVIAGWEQELQGMNEGETRTLTTTDEMPGSSSRTTWSCEGLRTAYAPVPPAMIERSAATRIAPAANFTAK